LEQVANDQLNGYGVQVIKKSKIDWAKKLLVNNEQFKGKSLYNRTGL
jgi:hypothetical protein